MKNFILFIYLIPFMSFANGKDSISISVIEIADSNFYYLLDSILELDKNCSYFSDSLCYTVVIYDSVYDGLPFYYLIFEGNSDISFFLYSDDYYIGCIKYNKHYFFIRNKSQIFDNVLVITDKNSLFDGALKGKYPLDDDDSWPIRYFGYHNCIFYYFGSINDNIRCK